MRRICGGIACAAALMPQTLAAQDLPKERKKAPPAGIGAAPAKKATRSDDEPRLLDRVMMTIDNRVILLSEVEETYIATLTSRMRGGMQFDARLRMRLFQQVRMKFLSSAVQAQSAWSIPGASPERIQQIVESELARKRQEQIKRFGSVNNLLRQEQDSGWMGSSQFIRDRRETEDILFNLARQDFLARFRDRRALMITPRAMRAHYQQRAPELRTASTTLLALVRFSIGAEDEAKVRATALSASKKWKTTAETGQQVASAFGGDSLADQEVTKASAKKLQPFIQTFVDGAKEGEVSAPTLHDEAFWVLKIVSQTAAEEFHWNDPRVQNLLREELVRLETDRMLIRLERDQEKTLKIWPPLGRRQR